MNINGTSGIKIGIFYLNSIYRQQSDITYLLKKVSVHLDRLIILCDIKSQKDDLEELYSLTKHIYEIGSSQTLEYLENHLQSCKRLVLFDDSIYGPFYSLDELFQTVENSEETIWGITQTETGIDFQWRLVQGCLQPYFVILKTELWNLNEKNSIVKILLEENAAGKIIQFLMDKGYRWKSYISLPYGDRKTISRTLDPGILFAYELIKIYKAPFLKKACFEEETLYLNSGETARNVIDYITNELDYDESLIWTDLLKRKNVLDIKNIFHLEYIFPDDMAKRIYKNYSCAIVIHLHYDELIKECFEYIKKIPEFIDVYLTCSRKSTEKKIINEIKDYQLRNCRIVEKENRGRDISSWLVACREIIKKYEYFCVVHDKKTTYLLDITIAKSFMYDLWENTIKSGEYIYNILECFRKNPQLGVLCPPEPYHGGFMAFQMQDWKKKEIYEGVKRLAKSLELTCCLDADKPAFSYGTCFWAKTEALRPLLDKKFLYEDFPDEPMPSNGTISHVIERILGYVAQSQGYYTGTVMNLEYASMRGCNLNYMHNLAIEQLRKNTFILNFEDVKKAEEKIRKIEQFCTEHEKVYIYGAGKYGQDLAKILDDKHIPFNGFVVSDTTKNAESVMGHAVFNITELEPNDEVGIFLAMKDSFQMEVIPKLKEQGYQYLFDLLHE